MSYSSSFDSQDKVKYPCVNCKNSSSIEYELLDITNVNEVKQKEYILEIDFGTFLSINDTDKNETARIYSCSSCDQKIVYLADSGCKYIAWYLIS